jgi:hypothetical protein
MRAGMISVSDSEVAVSIVFLNSVLDCSSDQPGWPVRIDSATDLTVDPSDQMQLLRNRHPPQGFPFSSSTHSMSGNGAGGFTSVESMG